MKKFLTFLISLVAVVVVVSFGLTTFYFVRNDEIISFNTREIYVNINDIVTLDDLGFSVKKESKKTTYNFNAGDETVTSSIEYDENKGYYVAKNGGNIELLITTSNKNYAEFKINVHIGDGSEDCPYYISNQTDLDLIGDTYALNAHYSLRNDVTLTSAFAPIGVNRTTGIESAFAGTFNGNGYSISGLTLIDGEYNNAGLFTSLSSNAVVTDLTIKNVTISGSYAQAGALAGSVSGTVARVKVVNATITNVRNNANTGALIGTLNAGAKLTVSGVDNATINLGSEADTISVIAGGLVGRVDTAKVQAVYANAIINTVNATGKIGGLVGELLLGTNVGSIEESYSTTTSNYADFGAFIGAISKSDTYNAELVNVLYYLNGNYVVANSKPVVKQDNTGLYTTYYDATNTIYYIVDFNTINDLMANTEYVYYAIAQDNKVAWDSLAWKINAGNLPVLNMTKADLSTLSRDYLMKDVNKENVGDVTADEQTNAQIFLNYINDCRTADGAVKGKNFTLTTDIDLTGYTYATIDLIDSVFDGNGKTITLNLAQSYNNNLGLFGKMENSTVKNLTINVLNVSSASNIGAVAGYATSTDGVGSKIENVNVIYNNEITASATNFGGVVASIDNATTIDNVTVSNLVINSGASIANVGGLVANNNGSAIKNSNVATSTIYGASKVAGAVATNDGTIDNVSVSAIVGYAYNGNGYVGGLTATNNSLIANSTFNGLITISQANNDMYIGGVAGVNNGRIDNITLSGDGITVTDTVANTYYIGGVTGANNATIANTIVKFNTIGSYIQGKEMYVGGIASINSGANSTISRAVVTSNINGNYVAGIVSIMNNAGAKIDQVFVGKSATEQNVIAGDKFVAGVVYNFVSGTITNIQAVSEIYGKDTTTRSSLIVIEFPNGAIIKNATINSSLNGNGTFYLDTWCDKTNTGNGANYNVYEAKGCSGLIQSITINETTANMYGRDIKKSYFVKNGAWIFWQQTTYVASGNTNYYKLVSDEEFKAISAYTTTCDLSQSGTGFLTLGIDEIIHAMTYNFEDNIWVDNGAGISLSFLTNIV